MLGAAESDVRKVAGRNKAINFFIFSFFFFSSGFRDLVPIRKFLGVWHACTIHAGTQGEAARRKRRCSCSRSLKQRLARRSWKARRLEGKSVYVGSDWINSLGVGENRCALRKGGIHKQWLCNIYVSYIRDEPSVEMGVVSSEGEEIWREKKIKWFWRWRSSFLEQIGIVSDLICSRIRIITRRLQVILHFRIFSWIVARPYHDVEYHIHIPSRSGRLRPSLSKSIT